MKMQLKTITPFFILLSLLLIGSLSNTIAQETKQQDVVYLINGSILHGKIVEIKANQSVTLFSNCGDKWVINQSDIEKIEKEDISDEYTFFNEHGRKTIEYRKKGYYSNLNIGFLFSVDIDSPFPPLSLMFLNGYRFENGVSVGAGLGLDLLNEAYMPIVMDLKYNFTEGRINHFVYFQGGYAIPLETPDPYDYDYYTYYDSDINSEGGYIINPGIGLKLYLNQKNAFSFGIGYKFLQINHNYKEYNGQSIDRIIKYNRVVLSFGYHFW
ncbi:MAG: hypothetical protein R6V23_06170 [Bacteroidales bacterium]